MAQVSDRNMSKYNIQVNKYSLDFNLQTSMMKLDKRGRHFRSSYVNFTAKKEEIWAYE